MKVTEIAFSVYPVTDMERARAFYEGVFGLVPTTAYEMPNGSAWTEYEIGAGTLALGKYHDWSPTSEGANIALEVDQYDDAISQLRTADINFRMGPLETPVCHMAMVSDPEGNTLIIHKRKPAHS